MAAACAADAIPSTIAAGATVEKIAGGFFNISPVRSRSPSRGGRRRRGARDEAAVSAYAFVTTMRSIS
jgi:hypothetical protein